MALDPRLESDSTFIIDLDLSQVRLSHNAAFPWILLIPQHEGISEILELTPHDQQVLMQEIVLSSHVMQHLFQPTKLNVASLGNVVPQLHDQQVLMQEIVLSSHVMQHLFQPTKLNVASLGNVVPQLHVHIVARYDHDKAWPNPVWNSGVSAVYDLKIKNERLSLLTETFCLLK